MYKLKLAVYNLIARYYINKWGKAIDGMDKHRMDDAIYQYFYKRASYYERKTVNVLEKRNNHIKLEAWCKN